MKRFRTLLLVMASFLAFSTLGFSSATDVYITPDGSSQGVCTTTPHNPAWFNSSANWGSGASQIGPGTTVHLCGTITTELAFQGSGSSGHNIILLFESGARVQISPGADANGAIGLGNKSYITIDGGTNQPCGWNTATNLSEGTCNGIIENMLYGSPGATCPGGACTTQPSCTTGNLIQGSGGSNIEIRNLEVGPSYLHNSMSDNRGSCGILLQNGSNWNIHDNKLHDAGWHTTLGGSGSGTYGTWTIANNEMYNDSHMVAIGINNTATVNGLTMSGNYTHDMGNWDTTADAWHANSIHMYNDGNLTGTLTNVVIKNNIMGGNPGADMTAHIFSESQRNAGQTGISNVYIFNNLLYGNPTVQGGERLILYTECDSNCYFLNNTMIANATGSSGANGTCMYLTGVVSGWTVENNINGNCNTQTYASAVLGGTLDYNAYYRGNALLYIWDCNGSLTNTYSVWQTCSGQGSHSLANLNDSTGLNLSASYKPNSGSRVVGAAANRTSLCSGNMAGLCTDLAGAARPASGAWDIGAYQYAAGVPPPTGMSAVVH